MTPSVYRWPSRRILAAICGIWWALSAVATHVPIETLPSRAPGPPALHVIGYTLLTGLFLTTLIAYGVRPWRRLVVAVFVIVVYAAVDEATQPWFGRDGTVDDWLADLAGMVFALAMIEVPAALARFRQGVVRRSR